MGKTDIVVTTCGRLPYLKRTLQFIWSRTRTPYALHVLDDHSSPKQVNWLIGAWKEGKIETLVLRNGRVGLRAQRNTGFWLTFSDPFVSTDDDVLCPDVEPDWLARGLKAMREHPDLGVLALNSPQDNVLFSKGKWDKERRGDVQYCTDVYNCFAFIRRAARADWALRHVKGEPVQVPLKPYPVTERNDRVKKAGYRLGYLADTYCFHFGVKSARPEKKGQRMRVVKPRDMRTLEP